MLAIDFVNQGVNNFNAEKPDKALENFKRSLEIHASPYGSQKVDTLTIHYASVTARKIGRWEEAVELFKKLLDLDFKEINVHAAIASTLLEWSREAKTAGDTLLATSKQGEALKYLKEGIEKYPTNEFMLVELINYYLLDGDNPEQAEPYLDAAIKQYPERAEFYRVKGALFERLKQLDKAEEMYRKTLEIDPTEFTAQYQLGGILLDRVSEEHQRVNEIENVKVYNAEIDKVMKKYEEVLPYFERALELKPTDKSALTMLSKIYFMLRNRPNTNYQKKFDQMQERLKQ
jgi:tetratricopeptide (TPR) repeat protein